MLLVLFILVAIYALPAVAVLLVLERSWRWRWREVETGAVSAHQLGGGVYRPEGLVPIYADRAPRSIQLAAFTSLLFGQMFVPGLAMGVSGVLVYGVGLLSIPGLIVAAKLYRTGLSLLRRDPRESYFRAASAVRWSLALNLTVMAISLPIFVFVPGADALKGSLACADVYGVLSILQAIQLRAAIYHHEDALFTATRAVAIRGVLYPLST